MTIEEMVATTVKEAVREVISGLEEELERRSRKDIPEYMNYDQACEYVGVSKGTMRKFVSKTGLPIIRVEGVVRLRKTDIDQFLQKYIS